MINQTTCRFISRDRTRPSFAKIGLFAGLLVVLAVLSPLQILAQGSGPNEPTKRLFQAVHDNNMAAVQVSVTNGADIEALDKNGLAAVDIAVDEGFFDIAHFLLSVRNARDRPANDQPGVGTGQAAGGTPTVQTPETVPVPVAPVAKKLSEAAPRPALPPVPAWPKGKPNPFDPGVTDDALPVLGKIEGEIKGGGAAEIPPTPLSPPKAVAAAPPPEPEPAPKPARKILKVLKEVAKVPAPQPPPPLPVQEVAETPPPPPPMTLVPPPPPSEERPAAKTKTGPETLKARSLKSNAAPVSRSTPAPAAQAAQAAQTAQTEAEPPPGFIEKTSDFFRGLFSDTSTPPRPKPQKAPNPSKTTAANWWSGR